MVAKLNTGFADFSWSPTGTHLAFIGDLEDDGTFDLYKAAISGAGITQLTNDDALESSPTWSPNGARVAFQRSGDAEQEDGIFSVKVDGTDLQRLTSSRDHFSPSWSPDGVRIAFVSFEPDGSSDIWAIKTDGTELERLTSDCRVEFDLNWLDNSRRIIYASSDDTAACPHPRDGEIRSVGLDGTRRNITRDGRNDGALGLSPDNEWIVYHSAGKKRERDFELYRIRVNGRSRTPLTDNGSDIQDVLPDW